jgi:23S rRNA (guanosine2251-2'-O)-methyltransferase
VATESEAICGVRAVFEALASRRRPVERIHIAREASLSRFQDIIQSAQEQGVPVRREARAALDRLARGSIHQGIVAILGEFAYSSLEALFGSGKPLVVVLDGVEDPQNLGAVIRTSEACGVSGVIVPERHSAPLSAAVARASAGASAYVPVVRVTNLARTLVDLKERGLWVVGVDLVATQNWTAFDYKGPIALVFGGEHRGLRRLVRDQCDAIVGIPMLGKIKSLNVSAAAAVVLYEVVRQRLKEP